MLEMGGAVVFYFTSIVALTFFNKWFISESHFRFKFVMTLAWAQQLFVFLLTLLLEKILLERTAGKIVKKWRYFLLIAPVGILSSLEWGLSNLSMRFITLSLYEMVKSTAPLFVLLFSFMTGLAQPSPVLIVSIVIIAAGTYFAVCGSEGLDALFREGFPLFGTACVLSAAVAAGLRAVIAQFVMQRTVDPITKKNEVNGVTTMFYVAPTTVLTLALPIYFDELPKLEHYVRKLSPQDRYYAFLAVFGSSIIALCVTISSFILMRKTSALTYSVVQIFERVSIVVGAMGVFGDRVGLWNAAGFGMTLFGIVMYNNHKLQKMKHEAEEKKRLEATKEPASAAVKIPAPTGEPLPAILVSQAGDLAPPTKRRNVSAR